MFGWLNQNDYIRNYIIEMYFKINLKNSNGINLLLNVFMYLNKLLQI